MKENTKLLLVWLYSERIGERWVSFREVEMLFPQLSQSGLRSLVFLLKKKSLVSLDERADGQYLCLTSHGKRALEVLFPAFSQERKEWGGEWSVLLFVEAPPSDNNFRYLRKQLLSNHWVTVKRGCYFYPGKIPERLLQLLDQLYRQSVLVFLAKDWSFGDETQIIGLKDSLKDILDSYSSISREIHQLIEKIDGKKELTYAYKDEITSLLYRLYQTFEFDIGITRYYFPQEREGRSLLFDLQNAV